MKTAIYGLLLSLFVLHTDVWYWNDPRIVAGLPIGITYHLIWTLAVVLVLALAVKYAWPDDLESAADSAEDGDSAP